MEPILSAAQIADVRRTFSNFSPELFVPDLNPTDSASFSPGNFSPALFYGSANYSGSSRTPMGLNVILNGFDGPNQPMLLQPTGTYFDRQSTAYVFSLDTFQVIPLHNLEDRMKVPYTENAPMLTFDRRRARIDPNEIDQIILTVRNSVAMRLPAAMGVSLDRCDITIEPSIFYASSTNFGSIWAGGTTEQLGGGRYRIRVEVFYINGQRRIADWREFLVHEAINFFVLAIGRNDLAQ